MARRGLDHRLEQGLFASRWLMAPFFVGLVGALVVLLISFARELVHVGGQALTLSTDDAIAAVLTLVDLSLAASLVLIVIFSGYENFVSRMDAADHEDRPDWMGAVDFSGLKLKLIASIVAISAIDLLKAFLDIGGEGGVPEDSFSRPELLWKVVIHVTFVGSGVLLALMDWLTFKGDPATQAQREKTRRHVEEGS